MRTLNSAEHPQDVTHADITDLPGFEVPDSHAEEMGPEDYPPEREPTRWPEVLPDWGAGEGTAFYGFTSLGC